MKTKAIRLHGAFDMRYEEFELPTVGADEVLIKVVTDSLCASTYKAVKQGSNHKRVPPDIAEKPIIIGHELCGEIVEVGASLTDKWKVGQKIVIDSRSFGKKDLIDAGPWLIKPNEEEIGTYTDIKVESFEDAKNAAEALRSTGIENVMISLGSKGAMLCCEDGCFVAHAPKINALSTIGAGDSSIAGFTAAAKQGACYSEMLRMAVCYGSAACMTEDTRPPRKEDVDSLLKTVTVEKL